MQAFTAGPRSASRESAGLLARLESSVQGRVSARLAVASAFHRREPADFAPAFEQLLQERTLEIHERVEACEMEDPVVISERRVFVEGLAILALADLWNFPTERDYLYCPSMARAPLVRN